MGIYNSISNIQRIAFIDKLKDTDAKRLSEKYPFAICYASENETGNSNWLPGFWKNGQRFGLQSINTEYITIGDIEIKLSLDSSYGLNLISAYVVKSMELATVYVNNINNILGDPYEIYNVENSINLLFNFYSTTDEPKQALENNFPKLDVNNTYVNGVKYVTVDDTQYGSKLYKLTSTKNWVNNENLQLKFIANADTNLTVNIIPYLFPNDIKWNFINHNKIDQLSGEQEIEYSFNKNTFHVDEDHSKFNFEFKLYDNNDNFISNSNFIINNVYRSNAAEGAITIDPSAINIGKYKIKTVLKDKFGNTNIALSELIFEIHSTAVNDDVYYIGMWNDVFYNSDVMVSLSDNTDENVQHINDTPYICGWHLISVQLNIGQKFHKYESSQPFEQEYDTIIIPNGYSLCLPLFADANRTIRFEDKTLLNQLTKITSINVNNQTKEYSVYKFTNNETRNKFINSILNSFTSINGN